MAFKVSTAKLSITPPAGMNPYMAGYGSQGDPRVVTADQPHAQPLYARCTILWDDGSPNGIVTLDILGIPPAVHQALRPKLVALSNWASSDLVLTATHTHNGPVVGRVLDPWIAYGISSLDRVDTYTNWLQDQVVQVVKNALAATRTSVTLDYQVASATFSANREGLPYNETVVPLLTARRSNGTAAAVLFSYGCHPVSAGGQERWDGDWPAGACAAIESSGSTFAQFLPGPAGDQNPSGSPDGICATSSQPPWEIPYPPQRRQLDVFSPGRSHRLSRPSVSPWTSRTLRRIWLPSGPPTSRGWRIPWACPPGTCGTPNR